MARKRKGAPRVSQGRRPEQPAAPEDAGRPITTGDMQEVGATKPEEVPERRQKLDRGEAPVHENPGDQNSG